jgi:hypothetical protein
VSYTIKLDECMYLMRVLSQEVRAKYTISDNEVSAPYIEQEYGVKIGYGNILHNNTSTVTFPSEAHYTMLMLKYYERTQKGFVAS